MPDTQEHREYTGNGNLRPPWEPGQSGNPAGRPRGSGLTDQLRRVLDEADPTDPSKSVGERLVEAVLREAMRGNFKFVQMIFDRMCGPVPRPAVAANTYTRPTVIEFNITPAVPPPTVIGSNGVA